MRLVVQCFLCDMELRLPHQRLSLCSGCCDLLTVSPILRKTLIISPMDQLKILSLGYFFGPYKEIILNIKIGKNLHLLKFLEELFLEKLSPTLSKINVRYIMYAPSSLWSRVHGRFDLAYFLAFKLAQKLKTDLLVPPWQMRFRWAKQAFVSEKSYLYLRPECSLDGQISSVVLVDDVVTSGNTLKKIYSTFPKDVQILGCTVAMARKK